MRDEIAVPENENQMSGTGIPERGALSLGKDCTFTLQYSSKNSDISLEMVMAIDQVFITAAGEIELL